MPDLWRGVSLSCQPDNVPFSPRQRLWAQRRPLAGFAQVTSEVSCLSLHSALLPVQRVDKP
jgi:hypothetical protein